MKGFDGATPTRGKSERMSDYADMVEWPENEYKSYRMIGPVYSVAQVWFTIATPRRPDGVSIPKMCLDHDGETDKFTGDSCPYRASGKGRISKQYYVNVIDREEQEGRDYPRVKGMKKETHLDYEAYWGKAGDSRKTPVRLLEIPESQIDKLKGFKKLNKVKDRDGNTVYMDISHPKYGCDINIMIDPSKKGPAKYDIQKGDRTPLTEEERDYIIYRPDLLKPEPLPAAEREMRDLDSKIIQKDSKGKKRPTSRREEADDPLMDEDTVRMSEDDLEDRPRSKKKSRDLDEDLDVDLEDDEPRAKKRRRSVEDDLDVDLDDEPKAKKRPSRDLDDDDEPAPRKRRASRDDDDEDAPRAKKRASSDLDEDLESDYRRGSSRRRPSRDVDDYEDL